MRQYYRGSNAAPILLQRLICISAVILTKLAENSPSSIGGR